MHSLHKLPVTANQVWGADVFCICCSWCIYVCVWWQLIDIYGSLLERPVIKQQFEPNYRVILQTVDAELNVVKQLYDKQMAIRAETGTMPIHKNMAPVSGYLKWAEELRERITIPMTDFRRLEHPYEH